MCMYKYKIYLKHRKKWYDIEKKKCLWNCNKNYWSERKVTTLVISKAL